MISQTYATATTYRSSIETFEFGNKFKLYLMIAIISMKVLCQGLMLIRSSKARGTKIKHHIRVGCSIESSGDFQNQNKE